MSHWSCFTHLDLVEEDLVPYTIAADHAAAHLQPFPLSREVQQPALERGVGLTEDLSDNIHECAQTATHTCFMGSFQRPNRFPIKLSLPLCRRRLWETPLHSDTGAGFVHFRVAALTNGASAHQNEVEPPAI